MPSLGTLNQIEKERRTRRIILSEFFAHSFLFLSDSEIIIFHFALVVDREYVLVSMLFEISSIQGGNAILTWHRAHVEKVQLARVCVDVFFNVVVFLSASILATLTSRLDTIFL